MQCSPSIYSIPMQESWDNADSLAIGREAYEKSIDFDESDECVKLPRLLLLEVDSENHNTTSSKETLNQKLLINSENGDFVNVAKLIKQGANICARDILKESPLHKAARKGHTIVMRHLLDAGANPYAIVPCVGKSRKAARTAMNYAIMSGNLDAVKILVDEYKYDLNRKDYSNQKMPLVDACRFSSVETVEYLLESGASIDLAPNAIFKSVRFPKILELLISYNADINVRKHTATNLLGLKSSSSTKAGAQPLHYAAAISSKKAIQILLKAGAEKKEEDAYSRSPLFILQQQMGTCYYYGLMTPQKLAQFNEMATLLS